MLTVELFGISEELGEPLMAADWIKMRTDLYRDPKVCVIADALLDAEGSAIASMLNVTRDVTSRHALRSVTRHVTVGALVTVWGVTRHRGKRNGDDLELRGAPISVIDDIADLAGFGKAMESAGWVIELPDALLFPNFFADFNVEPRDDAKAKAAARQRKCREKRHAQRHVTVTLRSHTEKSREEKSRESVLSEHSCESDSTKAAKQEVAEQAEALYAAYPRKVGKGQAMRAIATALKSAGFEVLMDAVKAFAAASLGRDPQFVPHPATWFNGRRWEDDRSDWTRGTTTQTPSGPSDAFTSELERRRAAQRARLGVSDDGG